MYLDINLLVHFYPPTGLVNEGNVWERDKMLSVRIERSSHVFFPLS